MFVLGIDPGLSRCGYCVLEQRTGNAQVRAPKARSLGVISTSPHLPIHLRLAELQFEVRSLLGEYAIEVMAIERVLFQVNVRTAMAVGQATGVVMAEAATSGAEVIEYSPNQVKDAVTGFGGASKQQVQTMVMTLLDLAEPPQPPDAADAAAVALCHVATAPVKNAARLAARGQR